MGGRGRRYREGILSCVVRLAVLRPIRVTYSLSELTLLLEYIIFISGKVSKSIQKVS